jgi:hypothetical protein
MTFSGAVIAAGDPCWIDDVNLGSPMERLNAHWRAHSLPQNEAMPG